MKHKQQKEDLSKPKCQRFLEKYIAPNKPKGRVVCYIRDAWRDNEAFVQVMFENPQDSDMIRVPNSFETMRVRVKVASSVDIAAFESWKENWKLNPTRSLQN